MVHGPPPVHAPASLLPPPVQGPPPSHAPAALHGKTPRPPTPTTVLPPPRVVSVTSGEVTRSGPSTVPAPGCQSLARRNRGGVSPVRQQVVVEAGLRVASPFRTVGRSFSPAAALRSVTLPVYTTPRVPPATQGVVKQRLGGPAQQQRVVGPFQFLPPAPPRSLMSSNRPPRVQGAPGSHRQVVKQPAMRRVNSWAPSLPVQSSVPVPTPQSIRTDTARARQAQKPSEAAFSSHVLQSAIDCVFLAIGLPPPPLDPATLCVLARDFEMENPSLPMKWQEDAACCARCAQHVCVLLFDLASGDRVLVPVAPGRGVPVAEKTLITEECAEAEDWPLQYAPACGVQGPVRQVLAAWGDGDSWRRQVLRPLFRQIDKKGTGLLNWRVGDVKQFMEFFLQAACGLAPPRCPSAVWYQLVRECGSGIRAGLNEEQAAFLARTFLERLILFNENESAIDCALQFNASVNESRERKPEACVNDFARSLLDRMGNSKPTTKAKTEDESPKPGCVRDAIRRLQRARCASEDQSASAEASPQTTQAPSLRSSEAARLNWYGGPPLVRPPSDSATFQTVVAKDPPAWYSFQASDVSNGDAETNTGQPKAAPQVILRKDPESTPEDVGVAENPDATSPVFVPFLQVMEESFVLPELPPAEPICFAHAPRLYSRGGYKPRAAPANLEELHDDLQNYSVCSEVRHADEIVLASPKDEFRKDHRSAAFSGFLQEQVLTTSAPLAELVHAAQHAMQTQSIDGTEVSMPAVLGAAYLEISQAAYEDEESVSPTKRRLSSKSMSGMSVETESEAQSELMRALRRRRQKVDCGECYESQNSGIESKLGNLPSPARNRRPSVRSEAGTEQSEYTTLLLEDDLHGVHAPPIAEQADAAAVRKGADAAPADVSELLAVMQSTCASLADRLKSNLPRTDGNRLEQRRRRRSSFVDSDAWSAEKTGGGLGEMSQEAAIAAADAARQLLGQLETAFLSGGATGSDYLPKAAVADGGAQCFNISTPTRRSIVVPSAMVVEDSVIDFQRKPERRHSWPTTTKEGEASSECDGDPYADHMFEFLGRERFLQMHAAAAGVTATSAGGAEPTRRRRATEHHHKNSRPADPDLPAPLGALGQWAEQLLQSSPDPCPELRPPRLESPGLADAPQQDFAAAMAAFGSVSASVFR